MDEGMATMIYRSLARGKLARRWGTTTGRTVSEPSRAAQNPVTAESDRAIIEAVNAVATRKKR